MVVKDTFALISGIGTSYEFSNFNDFKIDKHKIYQTKINYTIIKWFEAKGCLS